MNCEQFVNARTNFIRLVLLTILLGVVALMLLISAYYSLRDGTAKAFNDMQQEKDSWENQVFAEYYGANSVRIE